MKRTLLLSALISISLVGVARAQKEREAKVRADKKHFDTDDRWIYNDLPRARTEAKKSKRPLLVVFRCIPCEACSRFDDQVVKRDKRISDLLDKFVCARIVQANRLDLDLFQFDYDQSFHAFLMNAEGAIYGRFGTRSEHEDEFQDMTMEGFAEALEAALDLHADYPKNKDSLAGKHGPRPKITSPEQYPTLAEFGAKLDYDGDVVASCMHCHQIRDAERALVRSSGKPMPDKTLYPYPLPWAVGLRMNAKHRAKVTEVEAGTAAEAAGFRADDTILTLDGQPILSIADIQWVLHQAPDTASIVAIVSRDAGPVELTLKLDTGWRKACDISWRPTTWELRRMGAGGLWLVELGEAERKERNLPDDRMALLVKYVGEYGPHDEAKKAGFVSGDIIVAVDGQDEHMSETQFLAHALEAHPPGEMVKCKVLREKETLEFAFPTQ